MTFPKIVNTLKSLTLLIFAVICINFGDATWHYGHEDDWPGVCQKGRQQSPINLQKHTADRRSFPDIEFKNYDTKYGATIINNGHSVALKLKNSVVMPTIRGGGLPYEYVVDHLHFHWESEHTIHSNRFSLELHIVHYANIYNSTKSAVEFEQGLAVLSIMFDLSSQINPAFEPLIEKLIEIRRQPEQSVDLAEHISLDTFLPKDTGSFFRYEGSLTTPGCDEVVIWTVFYQPSTIDKSQLEHMKSIWTDVGPLKQNYRALQKLNARVIIYRANSAHITSHSYILIFLSFVVYLFYKKTSF